ncbi:MAG TPA: recombinase family protein [Ruminococcus flavefaciens]|nr:recombinase family protein [Ruminococcus flavefaciens]
MPKITVIPSIYNPETRMLNQTVVKRRVAAYARVSTDYEEQITSYQAQVRFYTNYIQSRDDWEFVDVYTDEGISALNTKRRDGFNRMIADALAGKIDLIITKSVSRFARNTVDSLSTIRKLKEHNVECYFEKENIWTFDGKGELLISIMSSLAQEESRSISENVTWGQRKRFAEGKVTMCYGAFLGYRKGENGQPEIVPEEAEIVRFIYRQYITGQTPYKIAAELTAQGIPTPTGKTKWAVSTIRSILTNEKYKGDALLQKKFTVDFLTKKTKINEGEVQQYYVENSHPAIITPEEFDLVQQELTKREKCKKQYSSTSIYSSKIICGDCGNYFGAKVWHSNSKYRRVIYQCNSKFKNEQSCTTPHLYEPEIQQKFLQAFAQYFEQRETVIRNCRFVLNQLKKQNSEYNRLQAAFDEVNEKLKRYIEQSVDCTESTLDYQTLNREYEKISAQLDAEEEKVNERKARYLKMQNILKILEHSDSVLESFDENVWNTVLENMTVFHDGSMVFLFKDGTEIKI